MSGASPAGRRPVIGVMGSGRDAHAELARPLGAWLARAGFHLLTGGGPGAMAEAARGFFEVRPREGLVLGVIPGEADFDGAPGDHLNLTYAPRPGYPNPWVEVPIFTHLPDSGLDGTRPTSRNHINVLSSDAVIALPGGPGTRSEVVLALAYRKPVLAYLGPEGAIADLPPGVPTAAGLDEVERFVRDVLGR